MAKLVDDFRDLTPSEKTEFLTLTVQPTSDSSEEITDKEISAIAAQTFSRIDAEEEENGIEY